jgi:hypothetical protein
MYRCMFCHLLLVVSVVPGVGMSQIERPTDIPGCVVWLDAQDKASLSLRTSGRFGGGPVSRWANKADASCSAVQTGSASQPTLVLGAMNGRDAVYFDGNKEFLAMERDIRTAAGGDSIFVVSYGPEVGSQTWQRLVAAYSGEGNQWEPPNWEILRPCDNDGNPQPYTVKVFSLWEDGVVLENIRIGVAGPWDSGFLRGYIGEVVIYDRVLDAEEMENILRYLSLRWPDSRPEAPPSITIDADTVRNTYDRRMAFGMNVETFSDSNVLLAVRDRVEAAGTYFIRYTSGADLMHWNGAGSYDAEGIWHCSVTAYAPSFTCEPLYDGTTMAQIPSKAMDGLLTTYWMSDPQDSGPQWISTRFAEVWQTVDRIEIHWGPHYATDYKVQFWDSPGDWSAPNSGQSETHWETLIAVTGNKSGGVSTHALPRRTGRQWRVYMTASSADRYEIREIYLYDGTTQISVNTDRIGDTGIPWEPWPEQTTMFASSMHPGNMPTSKWRERRLPFEKAMGYFKSFRFGTPEIIPTINGGTDTAEEAARWVHYANHVRGYGITWWDFINEPEGEWVAGGPFSARRYADKFVRYAEAMKAVDPSIKLSGPGASSGSPRGQSQDYDGRTYEEGFLYRLRELGKTHLVDQLAFHDFQDTPNEQAMLDAAEGWETWMPAVKGLVAEIYGDRDALPLCLEEWGPWPHIRQADMELASALFVADYLMCFINEGGDRIQNWETAYVGGHTQAYISVPSYRPTAKYWAMHALYNHFSSSGSDLGNELVAATSTRRKLRVYANKRDDGILSLLLINKDKYQSYDVNINVSGFTPEADAEVFTIDNTRYQWSESRLQPELSLPPAHSTISSAGPSFTYAFPPYTVTIINLRSAGSDSPPLVEITSHEQNAGVNGMVRLTAAATDDKGIQRVEFHVDGKLRFTDFHAPYAYDWNTAFFSNGPHAVTVRAIDTAGKQAFDNTQLIVRRDAPMPAIIVYRDSLSPGWRMDNWLATCDLSDTSPVYEGPYSIRCTYQEIWGGVGFNTNSPFAPADYDALHFYVRGSEGGEYVFVNIRTDSALYGESGYGAGLSDAQIVGGSVSGSEWREASITLDEIRIPEGKRIIGFAIQNPAAIFTVYVDNIMFTKAPPPVVSDDPPTVTISSPAGGAELPGHGQVAVDATDDKGINRVEFYVDGTLKHTDNAGPPFTFRWDTTSEVLGEHSLIALAYDTVGQNAWDEIKVTVLAPDPNAPSTSEMEDFESGDFSSFAWRHSGHEEWQITTSEYWSATHSARAGAIDDGEDSTLSLTLDCTAGPISFHVKTSSEPRWDKLTFKIDGRAVGEWSGETNWTEASFDVSQGTRTFEWTYTKNDSWARGQDTAWIDDIIFPIP